jgi:tRNA-2-methylthio-N6-dimethylallyladenosine synthase
MEMVRSENREIIPDTEPERQLFFINKDREILLEKEKELGRQLTYHVTTFGCQMNARDSEKLRGVLNEIGYIPSEDENADLVIYNTCTVRENADNRVFGRIGVLSGYKKKNPEMKIYLCGCMMQEKRIIEKIRKSYPFIDMVFGTFNVYRLAELMYMSRQSDSTAIFVEESDDRIVEDLPEVQTYSFKAGVNIMYGCNNFCSYCIVPYVRGRERSRKPIDVIREIERDVQSGAVEVMLLGQNVNSYGKTLDEPVSFSDLLRMADKVDGIKRIRFMTSHPKDLSDDLIKAIAESEHVCHHIHLPLQSGSSRILSDMNRHYDKEKYLSLVEKIRKNIPDASISTDIIVGYPGETEEDFEETMDVVRTARFDSAFTFEYSKRSGTRAALSENQIPAEVVKDRFQRLLQEVQTIGREKAMELEGSVKDVLIEEIDREDPFSVTGRLDNNSVVHLKGSKDLIGKIIPVRLDECRGFYYMGTAVV